MKKKGTKLTHPRNIIRLLSFLLLVLLMALTTQREHDFIVSSNKPRDGTPILKLKSFASFFTQPFLLQRREYLLQNKNKLEVAFSLKFANYLTLEETPTECRELFDNNAEVHANLIRWDSISNTCYTLNLNHLQDIYYDDAADLAILSDNQKSRRFNKNNTVFTMIAFRGATRQHPVGTYKLSVLPDEKLREVTSLTVNLFINRKDFTAETRDSSKFNVVIKTSDSRTIVHLDKENINVKAPVSHWLFGPRGQFLISINFERYLFPEEKPLRYACRGKESINVNYMIDSKEGCSYGVFSRVKEIGVSESESDKRSNEVKLKINGYKDHFFNIHLSERERLPVNHYEAVRSVIPKNDTKETYLDIFMLVDRSQYEVTHSGNPNRKIDIIAGGLLLVIPAYFLIFFRENSNWNGIYFLQFGIVLSFLNQLNLWIMDNYSLENNLIAFLAILYVSLGAAYLLALSQLTWAVRAWQVFSILDYLQIVVFSDDRRVFEFAGLNIIIFSVLLLLFIMFKREVDYTEVMISFSVSLNLLNLYGDIWFFTNPVDRFFLANAKFDVKERDLTQYYLYFGGIFSFLGLARTYIGDWFKVHWGGGDDGLENNILDEKVVKEFELGQNFPPTFPQGQEEDGSSVGEGDGPREEDSLEEVDSSQLSENYEKYAVSKPISELPGMEQSPRDDEVDEKATTDILRYSIKA